MKNNLIIKHLNTLHSMYGFEKDKLSKILEKDIAQVDKATVNINISYYEKEMQEIENLVKEIECSKTESNT